MIARPALRTALAVLLGFALTAVGVTLGQWQTRRGDAKQALQAQRDEAERAPPVELRDAADLQRIAAQLPRRVVLRGSLDASGTVLVDNRFLQGAAGFQVVTPLQLESAGARVLVNRGWIVRDSADPAAVPPLRTPGGTVMIEGLAVERVPRMLELGDGPPLRLPGIWPNLGFEDYERVSGWSVARFVVQQTSESDDGLRRVWPRPASGVEKHRGYALQWYALAALSGGLTVFFGLRAARRNRP
jgi:cytochrome oxidase assembly protein ShyY1